MNNVEESASRPVVLTGAAYRRWKAQRRRKLVRNSLLTALVILGLGGLWRTVTVTTVAPLAPGVAHQARP